MERCCCSCCRASRACCSRARCCRCRFSITACSFMALPAGGGSPGGRGAMHPGGNAREARGAAPGRLPRSSGAGGQGWAVPGGDSPARGLPGPGGAARAVEGPQCRRGVGAGIAATGSGQKDVPPDPRQSWPDVSFAQGLWWEPQAQDRWLGSGCCCRRQTCPGQVPKLLQAQRAAAAAQRIAPSLADQAPSGGRQSRGQRGVPRLGPGVPSSQPAQLLAGVGANLPGEAEERVSGAAAGADEQEGVKDSAGASLISS